MSAFECKRCGACCKNLRGRGNKNRDFAKSSKYFFRVVPPSLSAIGLFEWELEELSRQAKEQSFVLKAKPVFLAYDGRSDTTFTTLWNLDYDDCPFFLDGSCSINYAKPSICKSYPLIIDNLFSDPTEPRELSTGDCPHIISIPYTDGKIRDLYYQEVFPYMFKVYGETFLSAMKHNILLENGGHVLNLIATNQLVAPAPVPKDVIKAVLRGSAQPVGLIGLLKKVHPRLADVYVNKTKELLEATMPELQKVIFDLNRVNDYLLSAFPHSP